MTTSFSRSWLRTPLLPAASIAAVALLLGYDRGVSGEILFGAILAFYAFVPVLKTGTALDILIVIGALFVILSLVMIGGVYLFRVFTHERRRWARYVAMAVIVASPLVAYLASQARDEVRFLAWAHFISICSIEPRARTAS